MHRPDDDSRFHVSEWLYALREDVLNALDEHAELAISDETSTPALLADFVNVCGLVFAEEKRGTAPPKCLQEWRQTIAQLAVLALVVSAAKHGLITPVGPIALSSGEDIRYLVTDAGRLVGLDVDFIL